MEKQVNNLFLRKAKHLYYGKKIVNAIKVKYEEYMDTKRTKIKGIGDHELSKSATVKFTILQEEIANHFCKYFTNIGSSIVKIIPASTNTHRCYLKGNFVDSVFLEIATQQEIVDLVNDLRSGIAESYDATPLSNVENSNCELIVNL